MNVLCSFFALPHGIADQSHATQLAGDINSRDIGLKSLGHRGDIDAPLRGAEDQRDCIVGSGFGAVAVTYAF